jgi:hypothetical protein
VNPETKEGRIKMTRRVLTAMGSATAVAAVVGGCLLLGPTPQAQGRHNLLPAQLQKLRDLFWRRPQGHEQQRQFRNV